jgi:hypothetical protein
MHQFLEFILFSSSTLHISDALFVHHHESKTVHTASGICQTDSADCLLAGTRCSISFPLKFEAGWAPELIWKFWKRISCPCRQSTHNTGLSSPSLIITINDSTTALVPACFPLCTMYTLHSTQCTIKRTYLRHVLYTQSEGRTKWG